MPLCVCVCVCVLITDHRNLTAQIALCRYFTGHSKNPDGTRQFLAGVTKVGDAVDGAIKIITVAVCLL